MRRAVIVWAVALAALVACAAASVRYSVPSAVATPASVDGQVRERLQRRMRADVLLPEVLPDTEARGARGDSAGPPQSPEPPVHYHWSSWAAGPPCPDAQPRLTPWAKLNATRTPETLRLVSKIAESFVAGWAEFNATVAVSVMVVYGDTVLLCDGFGHVNMSAGSPPPTCDSVYRLGSITKIFTSMMMLQAVERGIVALDDPLTRFFSAEAPPAFAPPNPYSASLDGVCLHSLAQHTSGVGREVPYGLFSNATVDEIMADVNRTPLVYPPFSQPHYSNLGSSLMGHAVARALQTEYKEWVEQNVLAPLNMSSSGFSFPPDIVSRMPVGYQLVGGVQSPMAPYWNMEEEWAAPAAGMRSTMADLASMMRHIFRIGARRADATQKQEERAAGSGVSQKPHGRGKPDASATAASRRAGRRSGTAAADQRSDHVLSRAGWNRFFLPGFAMSDAISSFGLATLEQAYAGGTWVQTKGGLVGGFGSSVAMVPELRLGVAAAVNLNTGTVDQVTTLAMEALLPALRHDLAQSLPPYPLPVNTSAVVGEYLLGIRVAVPPPRSPAAKGGYLVGALPNEPRVLMHWDGPQSVTASRSYFPEYSEHDPADLPVAAFRYWPVAAPLRSCFALDSMGTGGVAFFYRDGSVHRIDLPDMSMWGMPRISPTA